MSMSVYKFIGLRFHGRFYTGVISNFHQQWLYKGCVDISIPRIGRVIIIWHELLFKIRVSFDEMVIRKKVFSQSIHQFETHVDVVVEVLEVQISVALGLCLDEDFIEFLWSDITFEIPDSTNFCRMSTFQWRKPIVSRDHSGRILRLFWILLEWWGFWHLNLIHHWCDNCCEVFW